VTDIYYLLNLKSDIVDDFFAFMFCEDRRRLVYNSSDGAEEESDLTNKPVTQKQKHVKATKALKSYPPLPELPRAPLRSIQSTSTMVFLPVSTASPPSDQSLFATPVSASQHQPVSQPLLDQSLLDIPGPSNSLHHSGNQSIVIRDQTLHASFGSSSLVSQTLVGQSLPAQSVNFLNQPLRGQTLPSTPRPSNNLNQHMNPPIRSTSYSLPNHHGLRSPDSLPYVTTGKSFRVLCTDLHLNYWNLVWSVHLK
jgi:hypothetical protein